MNLHLLRMFVAVVDHNSFSRAAAALFVSQSAVSKGVRELESQLGDLAFVELRVDRALVVLQVSAQSTTTGFRTGF